MIADYKHHITILLTSLFSIGLFYFMAVQQDTSSFVNAIELLVGLSEQPDRLFRLSKPLALLLPALLYYIGIPIICGIWIQQWLAYYLTGLLLYHIHLLLFNNEKKAYLAVLVGLGCQCMAVYGLAVLVDGLGWAAILTVVYLVIKYYPSLLDYKVAVWIGLVLGLGFFIKESIIVAGIFVLICIIFYHDNWQKKLVSLTLTGVTFGTTVLAGSVLTWWFWQETIYHWWLFNENSPPAASLFYITQQSYRTLDAHWLLVGLGCWVYYQQQTKTAPLLLTFAVTALVSWVLFPLVWNYHYDRIFFMNALFLIPFIVLGADYLGKKATPLVGLIGLANLLMTFAIYKWQIGGLIVLEFLFFLVLIIACIFVANKNTFHDSTE